MQIRLIKKSEHCSDFLFAESTKLWYYLYSKNMEDKYNGI